MKISRKIGILMLASGIFFPLAQAQLLSERSIQTLYHVDALNDNPLLDAYDVKFYGLDVQADNLSDQIKGSATILVQIIDDKPSALLFELTNSLVVDRVEVEGQEVVFAHEGDEITISLPAPLSKGELVSTKILIFQCYLYTN